MTWLAGLVTEVFAIVIAVCVAVSCSAPPQQRTAGAPASSTAAGAAPERAAEPASQAAALSEPGAAASSAKDLDGGLTSLAERIAGGMAAEGKTQVAILDFVSIRQESSAFGQCLSEELTSRLFLTGKCTVIERRFLDEVMKEQKLTVSDLFEEESAVDFGKFLGVDAVLLGTFSDAGTEVRANARLISTETGEVFAAAMERFRKDGRVVALLGNLPATKEVSSAAPAAKRPPMGGPLPDKVGARRPSAAAGASAGPTQRPTVETAKAAQRIRELMMQSKTQQSAEAARDLLGDPIFARRASAHDLAWVSLALTEAAFERAGKTRLQDRGLFEEPLRLARQAVDLAPADPVALCALGMGLFRSGRVEEALPHLQKALDLDRQGRVLPRGVREHFEAARRLAMRAGQGRPPAD